MSHLDRLKNFLLRTLFRGAWRRSRDQDFALWKIRLEHDQCLEIMMSLLAINEAGHWATVMVEDTVLPPEMQHYLDGLVARA
jgi:hypothetical protein